MVIKFCLSGETSEDTEHDEEEISTPNVIIYCILLTDTVFFHFKVALRITTHTFCSSNNFISVNLYVTATLNAIISYNYYSFKFLPFSNWPKTPG